MGKNMSTIANLQMNDGEFSISMPDGTLVYCTANSETREDAEAICAAINKDTRDLEALRSGHDVVIPTSRDHAHALVTIGKCYLMED